MVDKKVSWTSLFTTSGSRKTYTSLPAFKSCCSRN